MAEKFGVLFENIQYNLNGAFIKILNSIYWQNNIVGTVTLQKYYLIESITMCSTKNFLI